MKMVPGGSGGILTLTTEMVRIQLLLPVVGLTCEGTIQVAL